MAVKTTFMITLMLKGFPYKDQIEELFIVMVLFCVSQHVTFSIFELISILIAVLILKILC